MFLLILGVLSIVVSIYLFRQYDFFASSPVSCVFKTLGTYKLSTNQSIVKSASSKGLIYIKDITKWSNITYQKSGDLTYSYTDFTSLDSNGVDVKTTINKIMKCNKIPEFSDNVGVNTAAALILCLQSNTIPGSRVFFVKCFVPRSSASDSNVIVGEIENNDIQTYNGDIKPVAIIQGALGLPNITDDYTLSYTICAAKSRPSGFAYSDCCKSILDTKAVVSIPMIAADTVTPTGAECTDDSKNIVSDDKSKNTDKTRSGLADPNCKRGGYSGITGGPCSGKTNTSEYTLALAKSKNCLIYGKWYMGCNSDDKNDEDDKGKKDKKDKQDKKDDEYEGNDDDMYYKYDEDNEDDGKSSWFKNKKWDKNPNEHSWPQKYKESKNDVAEILKPGFSECQKYYNCKKNYEDYEDDEDYEGQC